MRRVLAVLSAALCACGDNTTPGDASQTVPGFQPATHTPMPQLSGHGNTVLSSVRLVTLTFADDPDRPVLDQLGALVVGSAWYLAVGAEYNIGAGTQVAQVHLGPAPVSLTPAQAADIVQQAVAQHLAPAPASPDDQLLYMLHVPSRVVHSTISNRGFHTTMTVNQVQVPLALVIGGGAVPSTIAAARVLINTAGDPYSPPNDGYYADPPEGDPWSLVPGELADLCDGEPALPLDDSHPELMVPRVYSNAAASLNTSPCKPIDTDEPWTDISADPTQIQKVARGGQATFRLTGWSTQQAADWTVQLQAVEGSGLTLTEMSPELSSPTINNGVRSSLILQAPSNADVGEVGVVYVLSGPSAHPWPVAFVVQ